VLIMNNSKVIFVVVLVLTLLVGGSVGYLIGERISSLPQKHFHFERQMQPGHNLRAKAARHLAGKAFQKKLQERQVKETKVFLRLLSKRCNLTPEQQKKVKEILQSKRNQVQEIREDIRRRMQLVKNQTLTEIANVLTEEQKEQFNELRKELVKRKEAKGYF